MPVISALDFCLPLQKIWLLITRGEWRIIMKNLFSAVLLLSFISIGLIQPAHAAEEKKVDDYMPSLITKTPLEGRNLAILIVRKTVGTIQRDGAVKHAVRDIYAEDPMMLMRAVELVNQEFAIIALANNYWR